MNSRIRFDGLSVIITDAASADAGASVVLGDLYVAQGEAQLTNCVMPVVPQYFKLRTAVGRKM